MTGLDARAGWRVLLLAALWANDGAKGQGILIDDFNDGNDDGWTHLDGLNLAGLGPTVYAVESGRYHLSSQEVLAPLLFTIPTGAFWQPSVDTPQYYSQGALRALVRADNGATNVFIALRAAPANGDGYAFAANNVANTIQIVRVTGFAMTNLASAPYSLANGQDYLLEAQAAGSSLALKIWAAGASEPANPQLTASDATYTLGAFGVFITNLSLLAGGSGGQISGRFDDIRFISAGVAIAAADPPNGHHDVLQNTTTALAPQGIGVPGTPDEGAVAHYGVPTVTFSATPAPAPSPSNIAVSCSGPNVAACPTVSDVSGAGAGPYSLSLGGSIAVLGCTTIVFAGTNPGQKLQYTSAPGDVNVNGVITGQDVVALVGAINNGAVTLARHDITRNGQVTGQDVVRLVQLLNGGGTVSPSSGFNSAAVAPCP